jgi:hypothetical protein
MTKKYTALDVVRAESHGVVLRVPSLEEPAELPEFLLAKIKRTSPRAGAQNRKEVGNAQD